MTELNSKFINTGPLFIALAAFLWTTDAFVRGNLEGLLTANQVVLLEHFIIVLAIIPLTYKFLPKLLNFERKDWGALLFIGIGGSALATIALTIGFFMGDFPYQYAAIVVLLQQSQPIIAVGLAHLLLKERLPRYYYLFAGFAIIGIFLIILPAPTNPSNPFSGLTVFFTTFRTNDGVRASLFGLIAAILWGSSTVFGRYLLEHSKQKLEYFQMTTYRFVVAFVFLVLLTIFVVLYNSIIGKDVYLLTYKLDGFPNLTDLINVNVLLSIFYIALIVGLLSLILYYYGLRTTHASVSAIFELAFPLSFFILIPVIKALKPDTKIELHPLQYVGAVILVVSSTMLSYNYGKMETLPDSHATTG